MSSIFFTFVVRIKTLFRRIQKIIEQEAIFVALMLIFHTTVIIQFLLYRSLEQGLIIRAAKAIGHFFPSILLVFILAVVIHAIPWLRLRRLLEMIILLATGAVATADTFLMHLYGGILDQIKIEAVLGTDSQTWLEFLSFYAFNARTILSILFTVVVLVCLVRIFQQKRARHLLAVGITLLLPVAILASCVSTVRSTSHSRQDKVAQDWLYAFAYAHFPTIRVACETVHAEAALGSDAEIKDSLDRLSTQEIVEQANVKAPTIVFILGESTDRNHMSLYGYRLPTSPCLTERQAKGELAVYTDTIAPANNTGRAMPLILTSAEKGYTGKWYDYPAWIDIMRKAGYKTYWISNQEMAGRWGNFDKIFAARSDEAYFTRYNSPGIAGKSDYDEALLAPLDDFLANASGKSFYVIHLIGTHESYYERYPEQFAAFTAADEPGPKDDWKKIQAEYDNAVLYDDFVVNEIIKRFENKNALIIFISDHGMDLYDTGEVAGHTGEEAGSRHMIEIPFIIWASAQYRAQNSDTWEKMQAAVTRPYRTDDLFHTIFDAAGISTTSFQPEKSIFNDAFISEERIYNGAPYQK